jgi:hypothetical protein
MSPEHKKGGNFVKFHINYDPNKDPNKSFSSSSRIWDKFKIFNDNKEPCTPKQSGTFNDTGKAHKKFGWKNTLGDKKPRGNFAGSNPGSGKKKNDDKKLRLLEESKRESRRKAKLEETLARIEIWKAHKRLEAPTELVDNLAVVVFAMKTGKYGSGDVLKLMLEVPALREIAWEILALHNIRITYDFSDKSHMSSFGDSVFSAGVQREDSIVGPMLRKLGNVFTTIPKIAKENGMMDYLDKREES